MQKNAHLSAGVAVTIAATQPSSIKGLAICVTAATIGSLISDIDVTTSESHKDLSKILAISTLAIFLCAILEATLHVGIYNYILNQTNLSRILIGILSFLLVCSYGMHTSHRTFMHSIPAIVILGAIVYIALPSAVFPFVIAMISHIFLDVFNRRKIQILYPLKKPKIALKLCPPDGKVNKMIFKISSFVIAAELGIFIAMVYIVR